MEPQSGSSSESEEEDELKSAALSVSGEEEFESGMEDSVSSDEALEADAKVVEYTIASDEQEIMELDAEDTQDPPEVITSPDVMTSPVSYAKWWSPFRNSEENEAKVVTLAEEEPLEPLPSQGGDAIVGSAKGPYSEAEDDEAEVGEQRVATHAELVGAANASIGANDENAPMAVEEVVVQSVPTSEPEAENETPQEVFLKCLGLGGKWIQMSNRVVDEDAFYSRSETESGSDSDSDNTVSTVLLEQGEISCEENSVTDLPGTPETETNAPESNDQDISHDAYIGLGGAGGADGADEPMEENEESGVETVGGMSSDGGD